MQFVRLGPHRTKFEIFNYESQWPLFFRGENGIIYYFETCDESFEPKKIQDSYTMTTTDIEHAYYVGGVGYAEYKIRELCIQVRAYDFRGRVRSKDWTKKKLSSAFNEAREQIFRSFERGFVEPDEMRSRFIGELRHQAELLFGGSPTVRSGICQGNIPSTSYKVQVLWSGTCVSPRL